MEAMFYNQLSIFNHACRITGFLQVLGCGVIIRSELGLRTCSEPFSFLKTIPLCWQYVELVETSLQYLWENIP